MRYEVWSYSKTWGKWVRNVYPQVEDAEKHFTRLKKLGRRVHPPQPVNTGLPWAERMRILFNRMLRRRRPLARMTGHTRIGTPDRQAKSKLEVPTNPGKA